MPPSRREDLVDAAVRVFSREGFHATGIERVLQEAGVSRMTLYNHFPSKDDLIVAALRRKDEVFRVELLKFVERNAMTPRERIGAVFGFLERYVGSREYHGCLFINAAAEFEDSDCAIRRTTAEHKRLVSEYLRELCADAGVDDAAEVAGELSLLIDGAMVQAMIAGQCPTGRGKPEDAVHIAHRAADRLLDAALTPSR